MRLSLTNRRTWLTAGALSAVLTGGLTAQLVPTAAADPSAGTIRANTDAAPVEVPAPSAGPAAPSAFGPAGPAALPIAQPPAAQPVT
ncbi:MAG: hypothetical protein JWN77_2173, partial [Frankiales bacterium]|nr:hypothetical protein [Frankiales bacterium]